MLQLVKGVAVSACGLNVLQDLRYPSLLHTRPTGLVPAPAVQTVGQYL
jgi:hypothetical protein